jgi:hypothetical protein
MGRTHDRTAGSHARDLYRVSEVTLMTEDRLIQRLEEQLRDAHATNAELRERMDYAKRSAAEAGAARVEALAKADFAEKLALRLKQSENLTKSAQRKRQEAESKLLRSQEEKDALRERLDLLQREADVLSEPNARIETAKHIHDLFPRES